MGQPTAAGYAALRNKIAADWRRVVLYDGAGTAQLVLPAGDGRAAWGAAANPRVLTVSLLGSQADVVGKTFARIKVFDAADVTNATPLADEALAEGAAGPIAAADSLTITHSFATPL